MKDSLQYHTLNVQFSYSEKDEASNSDSPLKPVAQKKMIGVTFHNMHNLPGCEEVWKCIQVYGNRSKQNDTNI